MKAKYLFPICIGISIAVAACKEKEVDSKFITVSSPKANQTIDDKDSSETREKVPFILLE